MVNDEGVPITSKDIHRAFDIYGRSATAARGNTASKKISSSSAILMLLNSMTYNGRQEEIKP